MWWLLVYIYIWFVFSRTISVKVSKWCMMIYIYIYHHASFGNFYWNSPRKKQIIYIYTNNHHTSITISVKVSKWCMMIYIYIYHHVSFGNFYWNSPRKNKSYTYVCIINILNYLKMSKLKTILFSFEYRPVPPPPPPPRLVCIMIYTFAGGMCTCVFKCDECTHL